MIERDAGQAIGKPAKAARTGGLGGILTDYCMEIAKQRGVKRIFAITTTGNPRMISVFRKRGFDISMDTDGSTVDVSKDL